MLARALAIAALLCLWVPSAAPAQPDAVTSLRSHIKHVFIIYQENHSFDNYFGTFPGADNLSAPEAQAHGYRQYDPIGKAWVTPFRITDPDTESPSQGRLIVYSKMNGGAMDRFVATQETISRKNFGPDGARDVGLLTMSHYDCDTIPFLWKYAHTFALFDHIFSAFTGPSTPSAISLIAGQAGQTQWARDPNEATAATANESGPGVPVTNDLDPAYGPYEKSEKGHQIPQRYATLMLALAGSDATEATTETQGVAKDLGAVAASGRGPIPWAWYQEGYVSPTQALPGYETHHNAPQYFAYLRQNDVFWHNVHDLNSGLKAIKDGTLPAGGIFYLKGGSKNLFGWKPANPDPYVQQRYLGDDDHPGPGDTDAQIGQRFVATFVNAIAHSKYWNDSAIIVTWDDPGGYYDHVPPPHSVNCADNQPCGDGPRLPFILISPYARSGAVVSDPGDQISVMKFAETLFGMAPLSSLPDEAAYMPQGPRDGDPAITNLVGGFDPGRLAGTTPPIAAADAEIPNGVVDTVPAPMNCRSLGITPVTLRNAPSTPPPGWNPRPKRTPKAGD
ncbi:MAG TPA: alkaline phosphatase family protein [Candidatus Cybelea sp.]|jgi:phospholipase C